MRAHGFSRGETMSGVGRLGGRDKRLGGNQLGQFPQVLGSGGEQELVTGARGPAEPQPIETQRSQDDQGRRSLPAVKKPRRSGAESC
jgi:hypothetical protein